MPGTTSLATIGDNCIDRYAAPVARTTVGGNAVNVAVHLARLGRAVSYFGAVGADADGERVLAALAANRVDAAGVRRGAGRTAVTDLELVGTNDRRIAHEDFGACADYRPGESDIAALRRCAHVHVGWLRGTGDLKRRLASSGATLSQDLAVNADPGGLAVAFASAGEDWRAAEAMLSGLLERGAPVAVVTCGALGSLAGRAGERARTGVAPAAVLDTTGAGDTFIAGFLDAWLSARPLLACLEAGRDAAAGTCGHLGGFPQGPLGL